MPHIRTKKKPTNPVPTPHVDADAMTKPTNKDADPHHPPDDEDWLRFFASVARRPGALAVADIERLADFWTTYPDRWAEAYSRGRYPGDQAGVSLEHQYRTATRLLSAEAENRAIDSEPLETAADVCLHALVHHRLLRGIRKARTAALPERLPEVAQWRDDEVADLTRGKAMLARLSVLLSGEKKNAIGDASRIGGEHGKRAKKSQVTFEKGRVYDVWQAVDSILRSARDHVWLEDPFIDRDVVGLLARLPEQLLVRVLTKKFYDGADASLKRLGEQRPGRLEVKTTGEIHGRRLFVDDRVWETSESIKDLAFKTASTVIPIDSPDDAAKLCNDFESRWKGAQRRYCNDKGNNA